MHVFVLKLITSLVIHKIPLLGSSMGLGDSVPNCEMGHRGCIASLPRRLTDCNGSFDCNLIIH